jgi:hypothetical protein
MCESVVYPHSKQELRQIVLAKKKESQDLWYLNFLRDCIKAEVAIEKDAIFMTHDRLAHLYYKLICGKCGFLIAAEMDSDEYKVSF